jgi:exosome complex RNA-binding protein Rrp4
VGRQLAERPTKCEIVSLLNNIEVTVTKAVRAETKDKLQAHIETVQLDIKAPLKANVESQDTKTEELRSDMNTYVDRLDTMIAAIQAAITPLQANM